jgi:hypothetical protein
MNIETDREMFAAVYELVTFPITIAQKKTIQYLIILTIRPKLPKLTAL